MFQYRFYKNSLVIVLIFFHLQVIAQFPATINLSSYLDGEAGFQVVGEDTSETSIGNSMTSSVDINGDGLDDIFICTTNEGIKEKGACYVIYGSTVNLPETVNLSAVFGNTGFKILSSNNNERLGATIVPAGDFNHDGLDDLLLTSSGVDSSFIIFGRSENFQNTFDLSTLDNTHGVAINGNRENIGLGRRSLSSAGDVNHDGIDDLIIGYSASDAFNGYAYIIYGSENPPASIDLDSLNGMNGFSIKPINSGLETDYSVNRLGDINNDGIDDVIIGNSRANANAVKEAGASYVIFGNKSGFGDSFELSSLDGSNGFIINGIMTDDASGNAVSSAGDLNDDGIYDILIGAFGTKNFNKSFFDGTAYVLYGSATPFPETINLSDIDGINGFAIPGIASAAYLGSHVNFAGDLNNDGLDDISISADREQSLGGAVYILFGNKQGFNHPFDLSTLDGENGFKVPSKGGRHFLGPTGPTGDFNDDGIDDFHVGAPGVSFSRGEAYVIYGRQKDLIFTNGFE